MDGKYYAADIDMKMGGECKVVEEKIIL